MARVIETKGDLFRAPPGAALIHACNCQGNWGKGIAKEFKERYPRAFQIYRSHCQKYLSGPQSKLITRTQIANESGSEKSGLNRLLRLPEGTALIIPPQERDQQHHSSGLGSRRSRRRPPRTGPRAAHTQPRDHWIICLFTSWHYGAARRSPSDVILENTVLAVEDLKNQISAGKAESDLQLWTCKINAGLFGVPWESTKAVLEQSGLGFRVVSPDQ
ncbi:ADP-ribose 1''-phosphate phosphatase [Myotisia sp. PD_48]|nr:ADP-ribose 1''-phosphate phosphatase [Myotisia sp. PD_48]